MAMGRSAGFDEARRFARVNWTDRIVYRYGTDNHGIAQACDVSRGGFRVLMGRYLRPGTNLLLETPQVNGSSRPSELKAQIAWCVPEKRGQRFVAGIRVIYDEPDAIRTISALVNHAVMNSGLLEGLLRGATAGLPEWKTLPPVIGIRAASPAALAGNA